MKIVHAADLHIDSPLRGLERYDGAPVEKVRGATRGAFQRLIEVCVRERARFLVLAGDVFDTDWKDVNTGVFFSAQVATLRQIGCDVLVLRGNHDFEISRALRYPSNVREFGPPGDERRSFVFEPEGVVFHGVSYPDRDVPGTLLPHYPAPLPDLLNVGVLHTNATGSTEHKRYAPCTVSELRDKGYGYWALGHVHNHAVLSEEPWVVYPGNTQGRHANEPGPKGCVVLDVEGQRVERVRFADTAVMGWHRVEVSLATDDDIDDLYARVRARLDALRAENGGMLGAVRLRVAGGSRAHAAVVRDRSQVIAQIRSDALDRGAELWLEKVELETRPAASLDEQRAARGLVADLLRDVERIRNDEGDAELLHLGKVLDPLKRKVDKDLLDLGDPDLLRHVLDEAEALLAQRLTEGSDEP